jgi:hypothetical protein
MDPLKIKDFTATISGGGILSVSGAKGNISFSPAETPALIDLIVLALQASNLPAVPPVLNSRPFMVTFNEDETIIISRQTEPEKGLQFTPSTGDDLIAIINIILKNYVDDLRIRGGARSGVSSHNPKEPVLDGR